MVKGELGFLKSECLAASTQQIYQSESKRELGLQFPQEVGLD